MGFEERYSEDYLQRVAVAAKHWNKLANGVCCCCGIAPFEEFHHTSYGADKLGKNWFPVCLSCHKKVCHSKKYWIRLKGEEAIFGNHNKPELVARLKNNYKKLSLGKVVPRQIKTNKIELN